MSLTAVPDTPGRAYLPACWSRCRSALGPPSAGDHEVAQARSAYSERRTDDRRASDGWDGLRTSREGRPTNEGNIVGQVTIVGTEPFSRWGLRGRRWGWRAAPAGGTPTLQAIRGVDTTIYTPIAIYTQGG